MLLALETTTAVCSVVFKNAHGQLFEKRTEVRGSHSEKLFLFIKELMTEHSFEISELNAVLVSQGPGSYTGLRISASAVKGLLFKHDVPLFAVDTLAGFGQSAVDEGIDGRTIHAVIDARRVHLYHQHYNIVEGNIVAETNVDTLPIEEVEKIIKPGDIIVGTGIERLDKDVLDDAEVLDSRYITATALVTLYEMKTNSFVHSVSPQKYDPRYYTSRQVDS